jgi:hypothetical protein
VGQGFVICYTGRERKAVGLLVVVNERMNEGINKQALRPHMFLTKEERIEEEKCQTATSLGGVPHWPSSIFHSLSRVTFSFISKLSSCLVDLGKNTKKLFLLSSFHA